MNNKEIVLWIILLILFGALTFLTPTLNSRTSGILWVIFIVIIIAIAILKLINMQKMKKSNPENVKANLFKDNAIIKILWAIFIVSIIYDVLKYNSPGTITTVSILLLAIAYIGEWFLKKE